MASHWPGIRADRLSDQLWPDHAFPIDPVVRELCAANHFAPEFPIDSPANRDMAFARLHPMAYAFNPSKTIHASGQSARKAAGSRRPSP